MRMTTMSTAMTKALAERLASPNTEIPKGWEVLKPYATDRVSTVKMGTPALPTSYEADQMLREDQKRRGVL